MTSYQSWGKYPACSHKTAALAWCSDKLPQDHASILPFGQGRSYGDSCLNNGGSVLPTARLNHFLEFDRATGLLRCEGGVTLAEILKLVVPQGWFLPVTPGTRFVSVGGAIANDIHGKNHHGAGTFGCHVRELELLRSDGSRITCTTESNTHWLRATIGGLGLTGLITNAQFQLKRIVNPFMVVETIKFRDADEFMALAAASESEYEYTVAWVDCLTLGKSLGRGLFMRANHAPAQFNETPAVPSGKRLNVPFNAPGFVLNNLTIQAFNTLCHLRHTFLSGFHLRR